MCLCGWLSAPTDSACTLVRCSKGCEWREKEDHVTTMHSGTIHYGNQINRGRRKKGKTVKEESAGQGHSQRTDDGALMPINTAQPLMAQVPVRKSQQQQHRRQCQENMATSFWNRLCFACSVRENGPSRLLMLPLRAVQCWAMLCSAACLRPRPGQLLLGWITISWHSAEPLLAPLLFFQVDQTLWCPFINTSNCKTVARSVTRLTLN